MDIEWISAVLLPNDVAPHLNFRRSERITAASQFALVSSGRLREHAMLTDTRFAEGADLVPVSDYEQSALDAARLCSAEGNVERGSDQLLSLIFDAPAEQDSATQAALSLFVCVPLAELDRYDEILGVLEGQLRRLPTTSGPDAELIELVLLLQLGMRRRECGLVHGESLERARILISRISPAQLSSLQDKRGDESHLY